MSDPAEPDIHVVVSKEVVAFIRNGGGLLFVWATRSCGPRCALKILHASLDPPPEALDFRRVLLPGFMLFLHPGLRSLPKELWLEVHGRKLPHVDAYWEGLAYVA